MHKCAYIGEYYADIPSRRQAGYRAEMRRTPGGPTFGPMPELPARLWQKPLPLGQFSEANGRMEACSPRFTWEGFCMGNVGSSKLSRTLEKGRTTRRDRAP